MTTTMPVTHARNGSRIALVLFIFPLTVVAAGGAAAALRRVARRSGVSDSELPDGLPGDEVIAHPMVVWDRGITIHRPPEAIWPWLVQMGYGRAGYYTPEALDRWADRWVWKDPNRVVSPWRIDPRLQHLAAGDVIADGPGYAAYYRVLAAEPGKHLVLWSLRHPGRGKAVDPDDETALRRREAELRDGGVWLDFSWAFVLRPFDEASTRLLVRCRADLAPKAARPLLVPLGLVDSYETMGMLRGIKARAEIDQEGTAAEGTAAAAAQGRS
jgi:hypothetical protein